MLPTRYSSRLSTFLDSDQAHAFDCHDRSTVETTPAQRCTKQNRSHAPTVDIAFKDDLHPTNDARDLPRWRSRLRLVSG